MPGVHKKVTCTVCGCEMRSDHLPRHTKNKHSVVTHEPQTQYVGHPQTIPSSGTPAFVKSYVQEWRGIDGSFGGFLFVDLDALEAMFP